MKAELKEWLVVWGQPVLWVLIGLFFSAFLIYAMMDKGGVKID